MFNWFLLSTDWTIPQVNSSILSYIGSWLTTAWAWMLNGIATLAYSICNFALGLIDFMQFLVQKLAGIDAWMNLSKLDLNNLKETDIIFRFLFDDTVLKVFRTMFSIFIVLLIVFSIVAIVKNQYNAAVNGDDKLDHKKTWTTIAKSILTVCLVPIVLIAGIITSNAILAGLAKAFNINGNLSLGGQLLVASSYDASTYRFYAKNGVRKAVSNKVNFAGGSVNSAITPINPNDYTEDKPFYGYMFTYDGETNFLWDPQGGTGYKQYIEGVLGADIVEEYPTGVALNLLKSDDKLIKAAYNTWSYNRVLETTLSNWGSQEASLASTTGTYKANNNVMYSAKKYSNSEDWAKYHDGGEHGFSPLAVEYMIMADVIDFVVQYGVTLYYVNASNVNIAYTEGGMSTKARYTQDTGEIGLLVDYKDEGRVAYETPDDVLSEVDGAIYIVCYYDYVNKQYIPVVNNQDVVDENGNKYKFSSGHYSDDYSGAVIARGMFKPENTARTCTPTYITSTTVVGDKKADFDSAKATAVKLSTGAETYYDYVEKLTNKTRADVNVTNGVNSGDFSFADDGTTFTYYGDDVSFANLETLATHWLDFLNAKEAINGVYSTVSGPIYNTRTGRLSFSISGQTGVDPDITVYQSSVVVDYETNKITVTGSHDVNYNIMSINDAKISEIASSIKFRKEDGSVVNATLNGASLEYSDGAATFTVDVEGTTYNVSIAYVKKSLTTVKNNEDAILLRGDYKISLGNASLFIDVLASRNPTEGTIKILDDKLYYYAVADNMAANLNEQLSNIGTQIIALITTDPAGYSVSVGEMRSNLVYDVSGDIVSGSLVADINITAPAEDGNYYIIKFSLNFDSGVNTHKEAGSADLYEYKFTYAYDVHNTYKAYHGQNLETNDGVVKDSGRNDYVFTLESLKKGNSTPYVYNNNQNTVSVTQFYLESTDQNNDFTYVLNALKTNVNCDGGYEFVKKGEDGGLADDFESYDESWLVYTTSSLVAIKLPEFTFIQDNDNGTYTLYIVDTHNLNAGSSLVYSATFAKTAESLNSLDVDKFAVFSANQTGSLTPSGARSKEQAKKYITDRVSISKYYIDKQGYYNIENKKNSNISSVLLATNNGKYLELLVADITTVNGQENFVDRIAQNVNDKLTAATLDDVKYGPAITCGSGQSAAEEVVAKLLARPMTVAFCRDSVGTTLMNDFRISLDPFVFRMKLLNMGTLQKETEAVVLSLSVGEFATDYQFSGNILLGNVYLVSEINYIIMIFAIVIVFGLLGKAVWGLIKRIYEITLLFLVMPVVASTMPLDPKGDRFSTWKGKLISQVLGAYGVTIGLNFFFIIMPVIREASAIFTDSDFAGMSQAVKFFAGDPARLNYLCYILFLLVALTLLQSVPALVQEFTGYTGGEVISQGGKTKDAVKETIQEAGKTISGKKAVDAFKGAKDMAKSFVPGGALVKEGRDLYDKYKQKRDAKKKNKDDERLQQNKDLAYENAQKLLDEGTEKLDNQATNTQDASTVIDQTQEQVVAAAQEQLNTTTTGVDTTTTTDAVPVVEAVGPADGLTGDAENEVVEEVLEELNDAENSNIIEDATERLLAGTLNEVVEEDVTDIQNRFNELEQTLDNRRISGMTNAESAEFYATMAKEADVKLGDLGAQRELWKEAQENAIADGLGDKITIIRKNDLGYTTDSEIAEKYGVAYHNQVEQYYEDKRQAEIDKEQGERISKEILDAQQERDAIVNQATEMLNKPAEVADAEPEEQSNDVDINAILEEINKAKEETILAAEEAKQFADQAKKDAEAAAQSQTVSGDTKRLADQVKKDAEEVKQNATNTATAQAAAVAEAGKSKDAAGISKLFAQAAQESAGVTLNKVHDYVGDKEKADAAAKAQEKAERKAERKEKFDDFKHNISAEGRAENALDKAKAKYDKQSEKLENKDGKGKGKQVIRKLTDADIDAYNERHKKDKGFTKLLKESERKNLDAKQKGEQMALRKRAKQELYLEKQAAKVAKKQEILDDARDGIYRGLGGSFVRTVLSGAKTRAQTIKEEDKYNKALKANADAKKDKGAIDAIVNESKTNLMRTENEAMATLQKLSNTKAGKKAFDQYDKYIEKRVKNGENREAVWRDALDNVMSNAQKKADKKVKSTTHAREVAAERKMDERSGLAHAVGKTARGVGRVVKSKASAAAVIAGRVGAATAKKAGEVGKAIKDNFDEKALDKKIDDTVALTKLKESKLDNKSATEVMEQLAKNDTYNKKAQKLYDKYKKKKSHEEAAELTVKALKADASKDLDGLIRQRHTVTLAKDVGRATATAAKAVGKATTTATKAVVTAVKNVPSVVAKLGKDLVSKVDDYKAENWTTKGIEKQKNDLNAVKGLQKTHLDEASAEKVMKELYKNKAMSDYAAKQLEKNLEGGNTSGRAYARAVERTVRDVEKEAEKRLKMLESRQKVVKVAEDANTTIKARSETLKNTKTSTQTAKQILDEKSKERKDKVRVARKHTDVLQNNTLKSAREQTMAKLEKAAQDSKLITQKQRQELTTLLNKVKTQQKLSSAEEKRLQYYTDAYAARAYGKTIKAEHAKVDTKAVAQKANARRAEEKKIREEYKAIVNRELKAAGMSKADIDKVVNKISDKSATQIQKVLREESTRLILEKQARERNSSGGTSSQTIKEIRQLKEMVRKLKETDTKYKKAIKQINETNRKMTKQLKAQKSAGALKQATKTTSSFGDQASGK